MNTTTMRIEHYLYDDEEYYSQIQEFVNAVGGNEDGVTQVSAWLKQRFTGLYEHLDEQYIQWDDLARHFVLEIVPRETRGEGDVKSRYGGQ